MTEDEAKTKWCPYANGGMQTPTSTGRARWGCIASACMVWRWNINYVSKPDDTNFGRTVVSKTDGYCGLAGKP